MQQAIKAAKYLENAGFAVHIWSITSFTELAREAQECERINRLNPEQIIKTPLISRLFADETGVCVAVTDYMKALPYSLSSWIPLPYSCLGTDGFGVSEDRGDLRDYFEVSDKYVAAAALSALNKTGVIDNNTLRQHFKMLQINANKLNPTAH